MSITFTAFTFSTAQAQKKRKKGEEEPIIQLPTFNKNEAGEVYYSAVTETTGKAPDVYKKAMGWFNSYYKSPSTIIKERKENELIKGVGRMRLMGKATESGARAGTGIMLYDILVYAKDGRYKYELKNFRMKGSTAIAIEKMIKDTEMNYNRATADYLVQVEENQGKIIASLKKAMVGKAPAKKEAW